MLRLSFLVPWIIGKTSTYMQAWIFLVLSLCDLLLVLHSLVWPWWLAGLTHRNHCSFLIILQVHVKISVAKGIKFVGHPGKQHLTRKKCVAPGKAKPTSIVLSFGELGQNNITGNKFEWWTLFWYSFQKTESCYTWLPPLNGFCLSAKDIDSI